MKLYLNSVFAKLFSTNKCFQTFLFSRPVNTLLRGKLIISGHYSGFSGCMPTFILLQ